MLQQRRIPLLIRQFCSVTGLTRDTVRFYVKRGLLRPSVLASNRYQHFDAAQVERAHLIRAAQSIGFTLSEIAELAAAYEAGAMTRTKKTAVLKAHLAALDERAVRLRAVKRYLQAKLQWIETGERGTPPTTPTKIRASAQAASAAERRKIATGKA